MSDPSLSPVRAMTSRAPAPAAFRCTSDRVADDTTWIHATGELDLAGARCLRDVLSGAQETARLVVLDLHELTFMDTSAVHTVVDASRLAQRQGDRLIVLRDPPAHPDVFDLTEVNDAVDSRRLGLQAAAN